MLSLERQEALRRRYAAIRPGWQPGSQVYQDAVEARLTSQARVLDLGCGRGGVMERLHTRASRVVGLDPDRASLAEHRSSAVHRAAGLAERLPFPDASFDLLCCSWVFEHLPDPPAALGEAARVLRPGGALVFLTPNVRHPLLFANRWLSALGQVQGRLVTRLYGRPSADTFAVQYRANTPGRIRALLGRAGLRLLRLQAVGDPTYLAFTEGLFRIAAGLEPLLPAAMRVHLVGEAVREPDAGP